MTFLYLDAKLVVRYDEITAVRALTEDELRTPAGNRRMGYPEDAVTEIVTRRGTYYTAVPIEEFLTVFTQLERIYKVEDEDA